jgi:hypothetical protein
VSPIEIPTYEVSSGWADLSAVPHADSAWAHNGLVATSDGEVIGFHAGQLVAFDQRGRVRRVLSQGLTEGHGITLVREEDQEYLWISDPGFLFATTPDAGDEALAPMFGAGLHHHGSVPRVVKVSLGGQICAELATPLPDPGYPPGPMGPYCPCGTAVNEPRFGGNGDIWVADGYGSSLVHRFDRAGHHLSTLSGDEGAGRFNCPHAVYIDRRGGKTPELYIADRGNRRVQVYDLDGRYLRSFGESFLNSPSGFAQWGDLLIVAELFARLAAVDSDDHLVGYIGADPATHLHQDWPQRPGWPNTLADDGRAQPPHPAPDRFNSPHSVAVDPDGNLYVSEWLIGGRYTKLVAPGPHSSMQEEKP